jgi:cytoskeletal protein CcmA (bactofilin family)
MPAHSEPQRTPYGAPNPPAPLSAPGSYLGPGLQVKGEISGHEDLKLDGKVDGLVSVGGFRLTVGTNAHLKADLVAREALISGEVVGDIRAADRVEIQKSASITGNVSTGKIVIEEGAYFNGDVEVGPHSSSGQIGTDLDSLLRGAKKPGSV